MVEDLGQGALLEVAADDRDRVDGRGGRDAQAAERGDQAASGRILKRQVVDGGGEDVRDLLRDQLLGRRHPDVDRLRVAADRRARLLAERRVRLVADDELVRALLEVVHVPREPGVGLDGDQIRPRRLLALVDRRLEAVAVALGRELAVELGDEQAPVGEDQDAFGARRLDEPGGGDRLPRGRRVAEAVPALALRDPLRPPAEARPRRRPRSRPLRPRARPAPRAWAGRCRSRSRPQLSGSRRSAR